MTLMTEVRKDMKDLRLEVHIIRKGLHRGKELIWATTRTITAWLMPF